MWKLFDNFFVRRVASFFFAIVDVRYWGGQRYNSQLLDDVLWKSLNAEGFDVSSGGYTARVGLYELWIKNYPYHSGHLYGVGLHSYFPTLITRYRLQSKVLAYRKAQEEKKLNDYFN